MEWKTVKNFPNYEVSNTGIVRSKYQVYTDKLGRKVHKQAKELKVRYSNGYKRVALYNDDGVKHITVHRIVALNFIPKHTSGYLEVNHKDGVKTNNHVDNLEWVTKKQNMRHAVNTGLFIPPTKEELAKRQKKSVIVRSKPVVLIKNNIKKTFPSCNTAAQYLHVKTSAITRVAKGERPMVHGWEVKYI